MTDARDERIRLLEHQLEYLRAELLRRVRERDEMVYSASYLLFKPLRRAEAALVRAFHALKPRPSAPGAPPPTIAPPVVEAARRGVVALCSDIPVFREVGRDGAIYFRVNDPEDLASSIRGLLSGAVAADPRRVLQTSWADAARRIVDVIAREDWSRRLT